MSDEKEIAPERKSKHGWLRRLSTKLLLGFAGTFAAAVMLAWFSALGWLAYSLVHAAMTVL